MSCVYFISNGREIKVGTTTNLKARLRQFKTASASPLEVIGSIDGGGAIEKHLHGLLGEYRLSGEWFRDCPGSRAVILSALESGVISDAECDVASYERPKFGVLSPINISVDPHRLSRLDAELLSLRQERKALERQLGGE